MTTSYVEPFFFMVRRRNPTYPRRRDIFLLATRIYDSLAPLFMGNPTPRHARDMALRDRSILSSDLVTDIVQLCELIEKASLVPAKAEGTAVTLPEAAEAKAARTNSSLRDHSVDRA